MMGAENLSTLAVGVLGGALVGGGTSLWRAIKEQDDKCDFLDDMRSDMQIAFGAADTVLSDERTPAAVRLMLLFLLNAYSDDAQGEKFAHSVFLSPKKEPRATDNPLAAAMRELSDIDPELARLAHRSLGSLTMGLFVTNFGNGIKAQRVQQELASDPVSIWSKLSSMLGLSNHHGPRSGGGFATA